MYLYITYCRLHAVKTNTLLQGKYGSVKHKFQRVSRDIVDPLDVKCA